jgi:two-component system alkaline phosphatase synthesis response regulator PhoP
MQNILIIAPEGDGKLGSVMCALQQAGHDVGQSSLSGSKSVGNLCGMFDGRPPDILLADLSDATDCLAIRHTVRLLQHAWGEDMPRPVCIALLRAEHFANREWQASVDDFVLPPYSTKEIQARIEMQLFRKRHVLDRDLIDIDGLTIDLAGGRAVDESGAVLRLTPREFDLLRFLATHRGKFFARDRLLDMVWGVEFDGGERTVDIHMRRLRAKLPTAVADRLETRRGVGYGLLTEPAG